MSDTPRTDAEEARYNDGYDVYNAVVDADFARTLERELAEARRDQARYRRLRDNRGVQDTPGAFRCTGYGEGWPHLTGDELDAAIDAAMGGE